MSSPTRQDRLSGRALPGVFTGGMPLVATSPVAGLRVTIRGGGNSGTRQGCAGQGCDNEAMPPALQQCRACTPSAPHP
eukprot:7584139-Pyramimonas_sp.AAC.1